MKQWIIQCLLVLWGLCWTADVQAVCSLSFNSLNPSQSLTVDVSTIGTTALSQVVNFNVENTGTSDCYYFVTIDEGVSGDVNFNRFAKITHALPTMFQQVDSDLISYQLYSQAAVTSNIVKTLDEAMFDQNVLGPLFIQAGQTLNESFLIQVPSQTLPNLIAESYEDDVTLTLYQHSTATVDFVNDCPTCIQEDQEPVNIQFAMTEFTSLSLGDGYDPDAKLSYLDFEELTANEQDSFEVYVGGRSAAGSACSVTISSEHGSKLVHETIDFDVANPPNDTYTVDYTVSATAGIGNPTMAASIDLSTPNTPVNLATSSVPFLCGNNNESVMSMEVFITIGTVNPKVAGTYTDTLTIEATIGL